MPKLSLATITLKRFIFFATFVVSAVTFMIVIFAVSWIFLRQTEDTSARLSTTMANRIYGSIFQAMNDGRTHEDMTRILETYLRSDVGHFSAELHVGQTLKRVTDSNLKQDRELRNAFIDGLDFHAQTFSAIRHLYPLKAESKCLACHPGARVGEVLGVLSITEDIRAARDAFLRKFFLIFALLLPTPFLMSFIVARFINKRIGTAIDILGEKVHSVNALSDLTTLQLHDERLMFKELDAIFDEFGNLISRIKNVAVGKEMLEFEIQVLERFIITSDVIRDWKERVCYLLTEVNKVMQVYAIFCVFQIDEEAYDIEVFWMNPPSPSTLNVMDEIIRERIAHEKLLLDSVKVVNNVVNAKGVLQELDCDEIELQTKSLFLDMPQIGGVVGIGVQSQVAHDPIRSLVIGGILTTLLNVVGSIKAIYK
ncbi:MAG: hypothetical protein P4L44_12535, partial [Oryzomonas sp.]